MEYAIGLYDFTADEENEISTYKNEILEIVNKEGEWWTVRNKYGQTGLVPVSYLAAPIDGSDTQIVARGKTKKPHKKKSENELAIEEGKQVAILDNSDSYWWFVGYSGQTGYLPKNIIHEFNSKGKKGNDEIEQALKKFGFKEIAPKKALCDEETTVLFSFKNTLPEPGQFKVIFKGGHCEKTQDGERLNDFTIKTTTPKYHPAEKVFITINHVATDGKKQDIIVKGVEFLFQSKLDVVHKILSAETDPLNFLCSSFQINDLQSVDNVLSGNLEKKIPDGIDLLKSSKNVLVHEQALPKETPTLVHFAAYYNLKKLAKALLKCPGAKEAMSIKNCHGNGPVGVAKLRKHSDIEQLLEDHHINDTPDDSGEDVYESMEKCYDSYIKMGGNSQYVVPDYKGRSHSSVDEEELYEDMEGAKPEEMYDTPRDQEDRFDHYDDNLDNNGNRIGQEDLNMKKQLEEYKVFGRMTEKEVQLALLMKRVKERYITQEQALEMARVLRLEPQPAGKPAMKPPVMARRVSGTPVPEVQRKTQSLPRTSSTSSGSSMSSIGSTGSGYASDGKPPAPSRPSPKGFNYLYPAPGTFPRKQAPPPTSPRRVSRTPSDPAPPVPGRRR